MVNKELFQELFETKPEVANIYDIYQRTREIYQRTMVALGRSPSFNVTFSSTKEAKVTNGTTYSTKIYPSK